MFYGELNGLICRGFGIEIERKANGLRADAKTVGGGKEQLQRKKILVKHEIQI